MKQLLTGLGLAVALLQPAQAHTLETLLDNIRGTGTSLALDESHHCRDSGLMGHYSFKRGVRDVLTVCIANHNGNDAELLDTVLHEAVHVAQACNGGLLAPPADTLAAAPPDMARAVAANYPAHQFYSELEARIVASSGDIGLVNRIILKYCYR